MKKLWVVVCFLLLASACGGSSEVDSTTADVIPATTVTPTTTVALTTTTSTVPTTTIASTTTLSSTTTVVSTTTVAPATTVASTTTTSSAPTTTIPTLGPGWVSEKCPSSAVPILNNEKNPINDLGALEDVPMDEKGFWIPPNPIPGDPGDIIWARYLGEVKNGTTYQILYTSQATCGETIAVSAFVAVPDQEVPENGRTVISYGHGTKGSADICAPSKGGTYDKWQFEGLISKILEKNFVFIATDYEGLGTSGLHTYAQAGAYGKSMLDAARAAQRFNPAAGNNDVIFLGFSAGGSALAKASEIADDYAPDLNILGGIGLAGGFIQSAEVPEIVMRGPYRAVMVMAVAAREAAYGAEISPLSDVLTEFGISTLDKLEELCTNDLVLYYLQFEPEEIFNLPFTETQVKELFGTNALGLEDGRMPLLIFQPVTDLWVHPPAVGEYAEKICQYGQPVSMKWLTDIGHSYTLHADPGIREMIFDWIDSRLSGEEPPTDCGKIPKMPEPSHLIDIPPNAEMQCGNFNTQLEAQKYYEHFRHYDLPFSAEALLDSNEDGIMCGEGDYGGEVTCPSGERALPNFCDWDSQNSNNQPSGSPSGESTITGLPDGVAHGCGAFSSQSQAQTWFEANLDFGENVDANNDGIACGEGDPGGETTCPSGERALPNFCDWDSQNSNNQPSGSPSGESTITGLPDGVAHGCGAFSSQSQAQTWFEANLDFGENIDTNSDGIACGEGDFGGEQVCSSGERALPQFCD